VENGNQLCYHPSMEKLKHTTGCVYQTAYHIVWRPVYRRDVLREPVKNTPGNVLYTIAHQTCSDRLWEQLYYIGVAGHVSAETIRKYIEARERHHAK
jgi:REP element-mobilizing transposase RayT